MRKEWQKTTNVGRLLNPLATPIADITDLDYGGGMTFWKAATLIALAGLYGLLVYLMVWATQLAHVGLGGNASEFMARVWWETWRDIGILTAIYLILTVAVAVFWRRR